MHIVLQLFGVLAATVLWNSISEKRFSPSTEIWLFIFIVGCFTFASLLERLSRIGKALEKLSDKEV